MNTSLIIFVLNIFIVSADTITETAVVKVCSTTERYLISGSGFFVRRNIIATAAHNLVLNNGFYSIEHTYVIVSNGGVLKPSLLHIDKVKDLCFMQVRYSPTFKIKVPKLLPESSPGLPIYLSSTRKGRTALNQDVPPFPLLMLELPVFSGDSGAPVFDQRTNKVVGMIIARNDENGLGIAVPSSEIKAFLQGLKP